MTKIKTLFNLKGAWLSEGFWAASPVITRIDNNIFIDMSAFGRPMATGVIMDANTIEVTFPDGAILTGTLLKGNKIQWSNDSYWKKAKMIFSLNGVWMHRNEVGPIIKGDFVNMSAYYRPIATLARLNQYTIEVTFPDDDTFIGTLVKPNKIK